MKGLVLSALLVLLCSCNLSDIDCDLMENTVEDPGLGIDIIEGQAIVKLDNGLTELIEEDLKGEGIYTKSEDINNLVETLGIRSIERLFPDAGRFEKRTREAGLHRWFKITYDSEVAFTKASADLEDVPGIDIVEPVCNIDTRNVFNDPYGVKQWGFYNDGSISSHHLSDVDINVAEAWKDGNVGNEKVIVAVIDGGIDQNHEDLAQNCIGGYNFIHHDKEIRPHDHGTHVAGIIAAVNNNGKGVHGIAGGDYMNATAGVKLLSCQIFEHDPNNPRKDLSADGAEAIKWAADNGAVIAQNSWGYYFETYQQAKRSTISQSLKEAIDYFIENAGIDENGNQVGPMKGGVVFFAAGNDGWDTDPIGKYEPVISVAAVTSYGKRANYSNYGDWVDIAAPGGSFEKEECYILSTIPGNSYGYMNGTSMACPHVSGAAALIISKYGGQGFTPEDLKRRLIEGANYSVIHEKDKVGPLLDVYASLSDLPDSSPVRVDGISISEGANSAELQWKITSNGDGIIPNSYKVYLSARQGALKDLDFKMLPSDVLVTEVKTGNKKDGDKINCHLRGLDYGSTYEVGVVAIGRNGKCSAMSEIHRFRTIGNNAPVIELKGNQDTYISVGSHSNAKIIYKVWDPENHRITINVNGGDKGLRYFYDESEGDLEITLTGDGQNPGDYSAEIIASDEFGAQCSVLLKYELKENTVPVLLKNQSDVLIRDITSPFAINVGEFFQDPDGGKLAYDVKVSDDSILDYELENEVLNIFPLKYGESEVTVRAGDSYGFSELMRFKVLVRNGANPIVLYPNPVQDYLNIRVLDEGEYTIEICSSGGATVDRFKKTIDPFEDAIWDMTGYAPGNYLISVISDDCVFENNIIKL